MNINCQWQPGELLRSPLFEPLHAIVARLGVERFPGLQDCNALLEAVHPAITTQSGQAIRFVEQAAGKLAFEAQYEPRCYLKGEVQTRADNWHDLLNALVWFTFPLAKAAINARHHLSLTDSIASTGHSQRGAVRDTNTLLDESGVVVPYADEELAELLRGLQWKPLFWQRRDVLHTRMGFYIFGHGLYEKALQPYTGITGQGLLLRVEPEFFSWPLAQRLLHLDRLLADYLDDPQHCLSTRELTPVPLLGVPGWAAENEHAGYYDNKDYFRESRQAR